MNSGTNTVLLDEEEKKELLRLAGSSSLSEDMRILAANRHNPLLIEGTISPERLLEFLNQFNEFINHQPKPFKPIIEKDMRL